MDIEINVTPNKMTEQKERTNDEILEPIVELVDELIKALIEELIEELVGVISFRPNLSNSNR